MAKRIKRLPNAKLCKEVVKNYNSPVNNADKFIFGNIWGIAKLLNHDSCEHFKQK